MRHIPEEELHAYLDQALSRSQCVEIESHLAACERCRAERDAIAALRDRTTALLSTLAPPRRIAPAFEELAARQAERDARHQHRARNFAWAASVVAALGIGWGASGLMQPAPSAAAPAVATTAPQAPPATPRTVATPTEGAVPETPVRLAAARPVPARAQPAATRSAVRAPAADDAADTASAAPAPTRLAQSPRRPAMLEVSSGRLPDDDLRPDSGVWRTLSLDGARAETGIIPTRIEGLPIMQVQVRGGQRPVTVVAQQLKSGEVIRTIEGPAAEVSSLLARNDSSLDRTPSTSPWPTVAGGNASASIQGREGAMTLRRGDRILAITAPLPSDSLLAIIRRLNVETRGQK